MTELSSGEFSPQLCIWPLDQPPSEIPDTELILPNSNARRKYFEEQVPVEQVDGIIKNAKGLDDNHELALRLAIINHYGRIRYHAAYAIATMGATDSESFSNNFEILTKKNAYKAFESPRKKVVRKELKKRFRPPFLSLPMEPDAVAASAYVAYHHPEFSEEVAEQLVERMVWASKEKDDKPTLVKPSLPNTKKFIDEVFNPENNSLEPYIRFATILRDNLPKRS